MHDGDAFFPYLILRLILLFIQPILRLVLATQGLGLMLPNIDQLLPNIDVNMRLGVLQSIVDEATQVFCRIVKLELFFRISNTNLLFTKLSFFSLLSFFLFCFCS